jgi:hypothetical protein
VRIRVGHLYPDYLNIYADRGNIAVLAERARARGHQLDVRALGIGDAVPAGEIDLFYIGGGQDREQALVARDSQKSITPQPSSIGPEAWKINPSGGLLVGSICAFTASNCSCLIPANLILIPTAISTSGSGGCTRSNESQHPRCSCEPSL